MRIAFGPFELDLVACELSRDGQLIAMQPRVFDTLRYLLEHRDRIVSKQELLRELWSGQRLNSAAVPWCISHARRALGQRGDDNTFIQTIPRRGYRFVAEVQCSAATPVRERIARGVTTPAQPPFVGRARPLRQLCAALDEAAAGRGGLVLLSGEAGIGKTRCTVEFEAAAHAAGVSAWIGRCIDHGAAPACWPFIQILRAACDDPTLAPADESLMRRLLCELAPAGAESQAPLTDAERFWFLDRIGRVLLSAAGARTRLIIIDDLHCADESSLRALSMLSLSVRRSRLLMVATARDQCVAGGGHAAAALATRLRPHTAITLAALTEADIADYLRATLDQAPQPELVRAVHTRTGGNPLFIGDAMRAAEERRAGEGPLRADDVPLPAAAREFLHQRLAILSRPTCEALAAASVIGAEFSVPVLQHMCELSGHELLSRLHDAERARVLDSSAGTSYRFVHPLLRELVYSGLSLAHRAQLHARVGLALETLRPFGANVQQLAYHFHHALGAEYRDRVARYAREAGDAAAGVYAHEEAARFYGWALQARTAAPGDDLASYGELLIHYAAASMFAGHREEARARCEQALALARAAQLPELLVQAVRVLRPPMTGPLVPDPVALAALEEARETLPEVAVAARARVNIQLACIPPYAASREQSMRLCDEGLRLTRLCGDHGLELEGLRARMHTLSGPETTDALIELTDRLLDHDARPSPWLTGQAHMARYFTLLRAARCAQAEAALAAFGHAASAMRMREWQWQHERLVAHRMLEAGAIAAAQRSFEQLRTEGRSLGLRHAEAAHVAQAHVIAQLTAPGATHAPSGLWSWAQAIASYRAFYVRRQIEAGDCSRARHEFDLLVEDGCARVARDSAYLYTLAELTHAAVALGARDAARVLETLLTPHAHCIAVSDVPISHGSVAHHLGLLARVRGACTHAVAHFEHAERVNSASGHHLHALASRLALADTLSRGREGGCERATALARDVEAAARRCGATVLHHAASRLLKRLGPPRRAGTSRRADA